MGYYEGEISGLGCNNSNGMGSGWEGLIGLVLVAGLLGNGNFGGLFGGGRNGNAGADFAGWQLGRLATTNDVASGFSTSEIMSDLNDIVLGQAGIQQTLCQGFSGVNSAIANTTSTLGYNMLQGFNGIENALCTVGYQQQAGFNALGNQIASCCCDIRTELMQNRYLNEKQTSDVINASNANTRAILDFLTTEKISALQAENSGLKAQISNDRQSAYIIGALTPKCPEPAYIVPNPNCCYNYGVYPTNTCGASVQ